MIPRRTLVFRPTRDDITVGRAVFSVYASDPDTVRLNGTRPESPFTTIDLEPVAENRFVLEPLDVRHPGDGGGGIVCLSVKVWFNEVGNRHDALYYRDIEDRYALVAYCTRPPERRPARSRFQQNRVETIAAFRAALSRPFIIELNRRPLPEDGGR